MRLIESAATRSSRRYVPGLTSGILDTGNSGHSFASAGSGRKNACRYRPCRAASGCPGFLVTDDIDNCASDFVAAAPVPRNHDPLFLDSLV